MNVRQLRCMSIIASVLVGILPIEPFKEIRSTKMTNTQRGFLFVIIVSLCIPGFVIPQDEVVWSRTFDKTTQDELNTVCRSTDGGWIASGVSGRTGWLLKVDSEGNELWNNTYEDIGRFNSVYVNNNGEIYAVGDYAEGILLKISSDGNIIWKKSYGWGVFKSIQSNSNRNYYLLGQDVPIGAEGKGWIVKVDSAGDTIWTNTYKYLNSGNSVFTSAAIADDGSCVAAGYTDNMEDGWIVRIDPNGNEVWNRSYDGGTHRAIFNAIQPSADGGWVAVGQAYSDGWAVKVDGNGNEIWNTTIDKTDSEELTAIQQYPGGGWLIAGWTEVGYRLGRWEGWLLQIGETGAINRSMTIAVNDTIDKFNSLKTVEDGGWLAAGKSCFGGGSDNYIDGWLIRGRTRGPSLNTPLPGDGFIQLYWSPQPVQPSVYRIYRSTDNTNFTLLDSTEGNPSDTSYIDNSVENGTIYYYKVTSVLYPYPESTASDTVHGTPNAPPVLTEIDEQTTLEDISLDITLNATDPDGNDISFDASAGGGNITSLISGSSLTLFPADDWFGTDSIQVIASDYSMSDTVEFEVTVIPVNDAPIAEPIESTIAEGETLPIELIGSPGPDNESNQNLTYLVTALPEEGYITATEGGPVLEESQLPYSISDNTVYFSHTSRFTKTNFHYKVQDNGGTENGGNDTSEEQTVTITLTLSAEFEMPTSGPVESGITYFDSDEIYAAASGDAVYRFDSTGSTIYTLNVNGDVKSSTTVTSSRDIYIASTDYNLYSFNNNGLSNTGWPISLGAQVTASVAVDGRGTLYIGTSNGIFQAIAPSGEVQWGYNVGAPVYASAAISENNTLYIVNEGGRVFAFNLETINSDNVEYSWIYELGETVTTSPALDGRGNLFIASTEGTLFKLHDDGADAQVVWDYSIDGSIESSPIIGADYGVYFGGTKNTVCKIDSTGTLEWITDVGSAVRSTGALAEFNTSADRVYFGTDTGMLHALATADGKIIWQYNAQSTILGSILYADNIVYCGTNDGQVLAIEDTEVQSGFAKSTGVNRVWPTFQGNNARTGLFGMLPSIPTISHIYPGDTNNDGIVNAEDILPIGIYFLMTGVERQSASFAWSQQQVTSWPLYPANYADCNGDGIVDEKDVVAIGVNWGKTHTDTLSKIHIDPTDQARLANHREAFRTLYQSIQHMDGEAGMALKNMLERVLEIAPQEYVLHQNYPNPFNPETNIQFSLPEATTVNLVIYNVKGEVVSTLIDHIKMSPGYYNREFVGTESSSGVYFYELQTPQFHQIKKMVLVK